MDTTYNTDYATDDMRTSTVLSTSNPGQQLLGLALRLGTSVTMAALVTFALLLLMYFLIAMRTPVIEESTPHKFDVIMNEDREIQAQPEEKAKKPDEVTAPPPMIALIPNLEDPGEYTTSVPPPAIKDTINIKAGNGSGAAVPQMQVGPQYPRRAQVKGIEGFVDLLFDISPTGKTENIRVLYAEPEGYFESASIKALSRWKYKPAMDDGIAYSQRDQTTRIKFELDK